MTEMSLFTSESVTEAHPDKFGREDPTFTSERTDRAGELRALAGA